MLASILIIAVSMVLLMYWFRYTCLLLLGGSKARALSADDSPSGLTHLQVPRDEIAPLRKALDRDYAVLSYVLRHAGGITLDPVERHFLTVDFRLLRFWYWLARTLSLPYGNRALDEMSAILRFLESRLGAQPTR